MARFSLLNRASAVRIGPGERQGRDKAFGPEHSRPELTGRIGPMRLEPTALRGLLCRPTLSGKGTDEDEWP